MSAKSDPLKEFRLDTLIAELRTREARARNTPDASDRVPLPALKQFTSRELIVIVRDRQQAIYGSDDRRDVFEVATQLPLQESIDSVVAIFKSEDVQDNGDGTFTIRTQTLGTRYSDMCPTEKYVEQPVALHGLVGSGVLVADDVIATAGHCIDDTNVASRLFVFGFQMINGTDAKTVIEVGEIYRGVSLIDRQSSTTGADWALVRLDRPVTGHHVAAVRTAGAIADDAPVYVVGHPSSLPLKYAGNANVRDNTPSTHFVANLDTYGGNSGSPVFNAGSHTVEGILVRGETDYVYNTEGTCLVSLICPDTGCRGQDCTRVTEFAHLI